MKIVRTILMAVIALLIGGAGAFAQNDRSLMRYVVQDGDTIFMDEIKPARIHPKQTMSSKEWKLYYKRVHNFAKAYPYAILVADVIKETDSVFAARGFNSRDKEKYLNSMKEELIDNFEPIFRKLTLNQGLMMIRLIDREVGMTPYYIIQRYLGGINAGFWQGVAKLLGGNLKRGYDRYGEDKDLEELVGYWNRGEFQDLYFMIFAKPLPEIFIPEKFREPFYKAFDEEHPSKKNKRKK
ncbi:MAG: DUF4294 domain-containing protein [Bacteroidales bacterium]|nr:DUF4294 domain-containing protein [Bacteroidales bacterium]